MKRFSSARKGFSRTAGMVLIALLLAFTLAIFVSCKKNPTGSVPTATVSDDFKTEYYVGDDLVVQGSLRTYVGNGDYADIPITAEMISGFDTSTAGTVVVQVTYGDFVASVPITIQPVRALSLTLDAETLPATLYENNPFPSGVTMTAALANGKEQKGVVVTESMLGGFNSAVVGDQTVSITYLGATIYCVLTVEADIPVSISLVGAKQEYSVKEALFTSGVLIEVKRKSKKVTHVSFASDKVSGFSTALGGEFTAKVSYNGLECDYPYSVRKQAVEFALDEDSLPAIYEKGDPLPSTGSGLLTYDDKTQEEIKSLSLEEIPDFSTETAGEHRVDVVVRGAKGTYVYTVLPSIRSAVPSGYTSAVKQNSDFDGLGVFVVIYENAADGSEQKENIPLSTPSATVEIERQESGDVIQRITTDRLCVEYVTSATGDISQKIYFRTHVVIFTVHVYSEEESATAVNGIDLAGSFAPIRLGDPLVVSGVQVGIDYKYQSYDVVDCPASWVTFEMPEEIEGDYVDVPVTVTYLGATAESSVRVLSAEYAAKVTSISVRGLNTLYVEGDDLSVENVSLYVVYGGGYAAEYIDLQLAFVSGFDTSNAGEKEMVVTYPDEHGAIVRVPYRVITEAEKMIVTDLSVSDFDPLLFVGDTIDEIDREKYEVNLIYGYGYSHDVVSMADEGVVLSGAPFLAEGPLCEILLSYGDVHKALYVTVHNASDKERVTSISIAPDTVSVDLGQMPDLSQIVITVTYGYGISEGRALIGSEGVSVDKSGLDINRVGSSRVTVTYADCSCGLFVNFVSDESGNVLKRLEVEDTSKRVFTIGEGLGGVSLIRYYKNETDRLTVTAEMVPDFSTEVVGEHSVTICYGGRGVLYTYTVIEAPEQQEQEQEEE